MVFSNQQACYDAIAASTSAGQSGAFIDFMLGEIASTLEQRRMEPIGKGSGKMDKLPNKLPNKQLQLADTAREVLSLIMVAPELSAECMGDRLGLTGRQVRAQLAKLKAQGLIVREGSNKKGRWKLL